jgi:hypothetical protein
VNAFRPILTLLAAALALGLVACGGDDGGDEPSPEDEAAITKAVEAGLTSADASKCTRYFTAAYSQQIHFTPNETAAQLCAADAQASAARTATVTNVEVDGDTATVDAAVTGGPLGDQTLSLEVVNEDGSWKLDGLAGFTEFDRASFERTFSKGDGTAAGKQAGACLVDSLGQLSDEELEDLYVSGDPNEYAPFIAPCFAPAPQPAS